MVKTCEQCGKEYRMDYTPAKGRPAKFCSLKCYWNSRHEHIKCAWCGRNFKIVKSRLAKKRKNYFCGIECLRAWQRRNVKPRQPSKLHYERYDKICESCDKKFNVAHWERDRKYCSKPCFRHSRREPRKAVRCEGCGKEFVPNPTEVRRGAGRFCSKDCFYKSSRLRVVITCKECGKQFERTPKQHIDNYCSVECRSKANRINVSCENCGEKLSKVPSNIKKHNFCGKGCYDEWQARNRIVTQCLNCGCNILDRPRANRLFCSVQCRNEYRIGDKNPSWRGGKCYYGDNWWVQRNKCLKRDKYTCQLCGREAKDEKWGLSVHHMIPFRLFKGDWKKANKLSNLITLCRKCHMKVEYSDVDYSFKLGG